MSKWKEILDTAARAWQASPYAAKAAQELCGWLDVRQGELSEGAKLAHRRLHDAVLIYEEAEMRAQKEATL